MKPEGTQQGGCAAGEKTGSPEEPKRPYKRKSARERQQLHIEKIERKIERALKRATKDGTQPPDLSEVKNQLGIARKRQARLRTMAASRAAKKVARTPEQVEKERLTRLAGQLRRRKRETEARGEVWVEPDSRRRKLTKEEMLEVIRPYQFKKGNSGNPAGKRRRHRLLSDDLAIILRHGVPKEWRLLCARLLKVKPTSLEKCTLQEIIAAVLVKGALEGDRSSIAEIYDRLDPKPKRIELTGASGTPIAATLVARAMEPDEAAKVYRELLQQDGGAGRPEG